MKRILLISGGTFILILIVVLILMNRISQTDNSSVMAPEGLPTAEVVDEKWNLISFPEEGVSLKIPQSWETLVGENIQRGILSRYSQPWAIVDVRLNSEERTYEQAVNGLIENSNFSPSNTNISARRKFVYQGRVSIDVFYGGDTGSDGEEGGATAEQFKEADLARSNSYLVGAIMSLENGILLLECQVYGDRYEAYIDECNDIVESLNIQ